MTPEARSRIQIAVEHSPDRRCVTIRRDDGRDTLAEIDRLTAGAVRAESHMAENHRVLAEQERELTYLRSTVEAEAAKIADLVEERDELRGVNEHQARSIAIFLRERSEMKSALQSAIAQLHTAESDRDAACHELTNTVRVPKADLFASWPVLWMSWALIPITGFAAYLAPHLHHG